MAATIAIDIRPQVMGAAKWATATVTGDASYTTGGDAVTPASVGLSKFHFVVPSANANGFVPVWDKANEKLMLFYGDLDAVADGALIQVAAATDTTTAVVELFIVGE